MLPIYRGVIFIRRWDTTPKFPVEYKGKYLKKTDFTKTRGREWTEKEIEFTLHLKELGYTNKQISGILGRSLPSVSAKIKRLGKTNNNYNKAHLSEKREINEKFIYELKPKSILDVYSGNGSQYPKEITITNDKNKSFDTDYHMDSFKLLCKLYSENQKFDIIDLDPFGSAYDCFDLAIKMAKKGLVITLGEMGHKRWKRLDFIQRYYNIDSFDDFNSDNLIKHIQYIGLRNKKKLVVYDKKDWFNISRVWFTIEPYKVDYLNQLGDVK